MITSTTEPQVQLVDTSGRCIGFENKLAVHKSGQLHLAFSVLLCRERQGQTEYLLQQRAMHKYHSGGLWTNTCCSHPMPNESIQTAAKRRIVEEIGLKQTVNYIELSPFIYFSELDNGLYEHEYDCPLFALVDHVDLEVNPNEAMAVEWWPEDKIVHALKCSPNVFTAWFEQVFQITVDALNQCDGKVSTT